MAHYVPGIGAKDDKRPNDPLPGRILDQVTGIGFKANIFDVYQWLSENYEPNDKIFLFGFSRGAFQARIVAGMIHQVGLIGYPRPPPELGPQQKITPAMIERAYKEYTESVTNPEVNPSVKVHFLGAWDTVVSLAVRDPPSLLETHMHHMGHVCAFRHALALDERRSRFPPKYAIVQKNMVGQNVKEVWFVGCHTDVGGKKVPHGNFVGPALRWMVNEAISFGLQVNTKQGCIGKWADGIVTESLRSYWVFVEVIDNPRLIFQWGNIRRLLGEPRRMQPEQLVHLSAFDMVDRTLTKPYTPVALMHISGAWTDIQIRENLLEQDSYAAARKIVQSMGNLNHSIASELVPLASTDIGCQAITWQDDALEITLKFIDSLAQSSEARLPPQYSSERVTDRALMSALVDILSAFPRQPTRSRNHDYASIIRKVVSNDRRTDELNQLLQSIKTFVEDWPNEQLLRSLTDCEVVKDAWLDEHRLRKLCQDLRKRVQPGPDPEGSPDILRLQGLLQDLEKLVENEHRLVKILQNIGKLPFYEHTGEITAVAYSPNGAQLASGSGDGTIRIWDATSGLASGVALERDKSIRITSIAISHDGRIVSGSEDGAVLRWIWSNAPQEAIELGKHAKAVSSVACSSDGIIASASADKTIRIWGAGSDSTSGSAILEGHGDTVLSITFSTNGELMFSASRDRTVRVWKKKTNGVSYQLWFDVNHQRAVNSVACSPDDHYFVSGSDDQSCYIWEVKAEQQRPREFRVPLEISGNITSVIFSPSGEQVAAASKEEVVIWNRWDGEVKHRLRGHAAIITSLAVWQAPLDSADHERRERIVTASWDKTLRVWDMQSGQQLVGPVGAWTAEMIAYEHP
ncbi:WD40 repeat-like protein [Pleurotus eryngii]|uniref:WD40 repeat-like protein n=1 Tax=Pleurotus eryngii TaxID=5323 RepID=A0A9P5ZSP7_PLEER|nr:WD40 repeat-like protein [Pleurotus eryngii]